MLAVANFHYIRENFDAKYPSIFGLTPCQFENQLEELAQHGEFVSQEVLLDSNNKTAEGNFLLITFDDGLKEQYELAKPILDRKGIPFVCFINTSNFTENKVSLVHKIHLLRSLMSPSELEHRISELHSVNLNDEERSKAHIHYNYDPGEVARLKYLLNFKIQISDLKKIIDPLFNEVFTESDVANNLYMDMNQLKNLWNTGSLGSHSHNHDPLGFLEAKEVERELKMTQDFFESNFEDSAKMFSYPYGSFEASKKLSVPLKNAGFKYGFSMERAVNKAVQINPYLLARYDCNDLPGGKANIFKENGVFENPTLAKWHTYEDGTFNQ